MREKWQKQMPFMAHIQDHIQSQELAMISSIIDSTPTICQHILQDLNKGKAVSRRTGAKGMSADQGDLWGTFGGGTFAGPLGTPHTFVVHGIKWF